mgnify:CR=1 FL=1
MGRISQLAIETEDWLRWNPVARAVGLPLDHRLLPKARSKSAATIEDFSNLSVAAAFEFFRRLKFKGRAAAIARDILPEIRERLAFLSEVGLGYLQLGRGVPTLSGGEAQRVRAGVAATSKAIAGGARWDRAKQSQTERGQPSLWRRIVSADSPAGGWFGGGKRHSQLIQS